MTKRLIPNGIYTRFGVTLIAINEDYLVQIAGSDTTKYEATDDHELLSTPGSGEWIAAMVNVRSSLAKDLANEQAELRSKDTWIENLGEAIRDKAVEHEWCGEYDEFAEEWDLPLRTHEYDVSLTIRVTAKDSGEAAELVAEAFSLGTYDSEVVSGPDYHAEKVM